MASRKKSAPRAVHVSPPGGSAKVGKRGSSKLTPDASLVEQELARYRSMRDFGVTAEPKGGASAGYGKGQPLPFVIQKHAATRLHYDFRLGWNGVLKSWAVTKGPSYFPGDKRLAVQVEDHPIEYGGFEGIIPKGQYGGGTVMLWDRGTWSPHGDANEGLEKGNLKFELHGEKLKGSWALIRMHGRPEDHGKSNWLLIKEHDAQERSASDVPITESQPNSVLTHRSLEEIAADHDRVWNSNKGSPVATQEAEPARSGAQARSKSSTGYSRKPVGSSKRSAQSSLKIATVELPANAPSEPLPKFLQPQLAGQVKRPPEGVGWVHELKLDGYRMQAHVAGKRATLLTRNGLDWTHRMKSIAERMATLPVESAVVDGEVVVLDAKGGTSFADLQAAFQDGKRKQLTYFAFDLLHLNGRNLRDEPLEARKRLLRSLIPQDAEDGDLRYSEHLDADGGKMFAAACRMGAEGIVSKLLTAPYRGGRSSAWLKSKCVRQQEFVVGGFTLPSKGGGGIGALLLGYYAEGKLVYAGRTGTGFSQASAVKLRQQLETLKTASSAFVSVPASARGGVVWVKPRLVAEVGFATWTADNLVRQAAFKGLREDKPAKDVRREEPINPEEEEAELDQAQALSREAKPRAAARRASKLPEQKSKSLQAGRKAAQSVVRYEVRLTHPDKQIDAESKLTKRQLAEYYSAVAEAMLPHVADRPLSIVRCPQGSEKPCFFQKHVAEGLPDGIRGVMIPDRKGGDPEEYITLSTGEALAGLAQLGVLEVHPWGSRNEHLEQPDRIIFDLDPDAAISWRTLVEAALEVKERLAKSGLETFVKSTGGKGLHVVAPIEPEQDWPSIKAFAKGFAQAMVTANPKLYLMQMTKAARKDKIYIDYLRNERGATAVAPYSPRARRGAAVAAPLAWKELASPTRPVFSVADFADWSERLKRDPWKRMLSVKQRLSREAVADSLPLGKR